MTDQIFYEELRATIRDAIASYLDTYTDEELRELATESLNLTARPTLADMTEEEREACQWMQADIIGGDEPLVITRIDRTDWSAVILDQNGRLDGVPAGDVTPRPDLPRMEWPGTGQDGEEATKVDYVSIAGGRTAYGPWTVARLRKKADTAPALPDGWRLADHRKYGRVVVTNPIPDNRGYVYYVFPSDMDATGYNWFPGDPDELTYIDQEA